MDKSKQKAFAVFVFVFVCVCVCVRAFVRAPTLYSSLHYLVTDCTAPSLLNRLFPASVSCNLSRTFVGM